MIGSHSVGNSGHGIGPSIAFFNPVRIEYTLRPTNLLSIELFAYTAVPEWGNKKVRIPLETTPSSPSAASSGSTRSTSGSC